ncbi:MAG: hypothetical protein ACK2UK_03500, partial [Candidatus Promineifilaceae bacterium]
GALCHYVTLADAGHFQPMKANFGLFSPPPSKMARSERGWWYADRALTRMRRFAREYGLDYDQVSAERDLRRESN